MTQNLIYLLIDGAAILAVAVMLYLTEKPMPTPPTQEQRVHAMLDDAVQNGYDITDWSVDDIVLDLIAFADLNEEDTEQAMRPHIITWKANRSKAT